MHKATTIKTMMQILQPDTFRMPQAADRFKIEVTENIRQYHVLNRTTRCCYVVSFSVTANNTKLVSCTCPDFANIRKHGRQCKHINVAYQFHVSRMKARQAVQMVSAVPASLPVVKFSDRHVPVMSYGKITVR